MKKKITTLLLMCFFIGACDKDFEEINTDPNNPTKVSTANLLTAAERSIVKELYGMFDEWEFAYIPHVYMQFWASTLYTNVDRYEEIQYDFSGFYNGGLADLQRIIELNSGEETMIDAALSGDNNNQIAVARILKAYTFQNLTDVYGDLPYSMALQGTEDFSPEYDTQEDIYNSLITELTEAVTQIDESAGGIHGDVIYGGDLAMWKLFANSLKMRIGMRMSKVNPTKAEEIVAEAYDAGVFTSNEESALFKYISAAPNNSPWHQQYTFGAPEFACSTILIDKLISTNDPRLEFYAQPAETSGEYIGMPYGIGNDEAGGIGYQNVSLPGVRMLAAEEPAILLGYWEVLFIEAEAAAKGWITADAATLYEDAIRSSMQYWGVDSDAIDVYLLQPEVELDESNLNKSIGEQKWLALYTQGPAAWSEWRRLGYPELVKAERSVAERDIPRRKGYPSSEATLNRENYETTIERQGPNQMDTRIWWDVE